MPDDRKSERVIHAPTGTTLSARSWLTEAPLRMLMNNLDPAVAEHPQSLVVYGGIGRAARNWECYDRIVETLRRLGDDETLLVQSGKPVGVFRTHTEAPRVLIANSNLVPHWANWEHFNELVRQGLIPAFVDAAPGTYNIDVDAIERMITPKTSAMMIPSLIGNLPDWRRIRELADAHGLKVIEDSADTLGATIDGTSTGVYSDVSTTSFYGSHVINGAGNGGMLCVNDDDLGRKALLLRSWGRSSSLFVESEAIENRFNVMLDGIEYDAKFLFEDLGYNLEPSEISAAFGLVQLGKLDNNIQVREKAFAAHRAFFAQYEDWFILPEQLPGSRTGWLAFPLTLREGAPFTRRELQIYLEKSDIQTRPVFTGNILRQPAMKNVTCQTSPDGYPAADAVMRGGILLACHHGLDDAQIAYMHETFNKFAETHGARKVPA